MLKAFDSGRLFGVVHGSSGPVQPSQPKQPMQVRVVALHGWRRTSSDFDKVLAGLGADVGALALDLPGFGASPEPPEAWASADYANAVAGILDGPVVLLGHSFGGRVAVHLAAARPDLVRALVLTGVPLIRHAPRGSAPLAFRVARWLHRRGLVSDARMEARRRRHGSPDYRAATGVMREVFVRVVNESYEEQLARIQCPVDLVWADDDAEARLGVAEEALALLGDRATLTTVPGAGHLTPLTAPDALRQAVERHL